MKPVLIVDIGNTNTRFGVYSDAGVENLTVLPTKTFSPESLPKLDIPVAIASVVPEKSALFEKTGAFFVTPEAASSEIDFSLIDVSTIGADRVANAAALAKYARLPAICVDCGTAITFELLDAKRVFRGGCIAPGRVLTRKSLQAGAARLPMVSTLDAKRPPALGVDTESAILAGCDIGAIGMVSEIVAALENEMGGQVLQVVAIGGDADFFSSNILRMGYGGPDFTLKGVAEVWRMSQNAKENENA